MHSVIVSQPQNVLSVDDVTAAARALGATGGGPGTARLLAVLVDPLAELDEVLSSLHAEPALAVRVLKVANSPFYHRAGTVGTLERAVQVLGLDAIRGICAACCMDRLPMPRTPGGWDPQQFRLHSLATAVAAMHLARHRAPARQAEAFIAGLLHDIGLVLLAKLRPQELAAVARQAADAAGDAETLPQLERRLIGRSHDECAALLARAWSLPAWLVDAVGHHHAPAGASAADTEPTVAALVRAADAMAQRAGLGLGQSCGVAEDRPGTGVGASDELIDSLTADLPEHVQALAAATAG
jgi:HD-like signal output (HDOD) protein